ncbi:MAG: hypothetical protein LBT02_02655, partial [Rickettsiales bacterium]|nr:hypothetical protein [Rickettsiales bacterium]
MYFLSIVICIIFLSVKPRKIAPLNAFLSEKFNTDLSQGVIQFKLNLQFMVPIFNLDTKKFQSTADNLIINFNIFSFFAGKIDIKNAEINNLYLKSIGSEQHTMMDIKNINLSWLEVENFIFNDVNIDDKIFLDKILVNKNKKNIHLVINEGKINLSQYFDGEIEFIDMQANIVLDESIEMTTQIGEIDFKMEMNTNGDEREVFISSKNVPLHLLKLYWPNFLDPDDSRAWTIEHILSGTSPNSWTKMTFKNGELQKLFAEVEMKNILLNYGEDFPQISDINGIATFTENDMYIKIKNGKVLNSNLSDASVLIDWTEKGDKVIVKGTLNGKLTDTLAHIDYKDKKNIDKTTNNIIEDYNTRTDFFVTVLTNEPTFYNSIIKVKSSINNKPNIFLKDSKNILLTFNKLKDTNIFTGDINLTQNEMRYFNFNKKENDKLFVKYYCSVDGDKIKVNKIFANSKYVNFAGSGYLDDLFIEDIMYDDNLFNIRINKEINIYGKQLNVKNIDYNLFKSRNNKILNFDIKKVFNGDNVINDLKGSYANKMNLTSDILRIENSKKIYFDDLGKILSIMNITDKVKGGKGEIDFNQKYLKAIFNIYHFIINISDNISN